MEKKYVVYAGMLLVALWSFMMLPTDAIGAKNTLVIGLQDDSDSLDPAIHSTTVSTGLINEMYQRLITFSLDDFTTPLPELAESWKIGSDGKTWIFHLRKDAIFASGNPVNADAVVFSLRRVIKFNGPLSWLLVQFGLKEESISKIDDMTVQIVLDKQYAPGIFLSCLSHAIASIIDQNVVIAHEENGDVGNTWLANHSAGSGRFVLDSWKKGDVTILKANPTYQRRDKVAAIEQVTIKNVQEPIEQAILLEKGEIDLAWNLQPDQFRQLAGNPDVQTFQNPMFSLYYIAMNVGYEPFAKPAVRDAIRYAINYDAIVDYIIQGAGVKIQTVIPKGIMGYNPDMPYRLDIAKAKQLLADAGYPNGFQVELLGFDYAPYSDIALQIKSDLAKIGITVKMQTDKVIDLMFARDFQLCLMGWSFDYFDADSVAKPFAHSSRPGDDAPIKSMLWYCKYVNPELAAIVDQASQEMDAGKREALYKQITATVLHDGPFAILFEPTKQFGVRLDAKDFIGIPSVLTFGFPVLR